MRCEWWRAPPLTPTPSLGCPDGIAFGAAEQTIARSHTLHTDTSTGATDLRPLPRGLAAPHPPPLMHQRPLQALRRHRATTADLRRPPGHRRILGEEVDIGRRPAGPVVDPVTRPSRRVRLVAASRRPRHRYTAATDSKSTITTAPTHNPIAKPRANHVQLWQERGGIITGQLWFTASK